MRFTRTSSALACTLLLACVAVAGGTIVGSRHDLSSGVGNNQVCVPCHAPHNAYPSNTVTMALWNLTETTQAFTMYTTARGNTGTPDGSSLLCLSCHDGVTAMDNYGGRAGGGTVMTGSAVVGTDLSNDHPIGIEYPASDPAYLAVPLNGLPLYNDGAKDRVECSSCHDVHGTGLNMFLRRSTDSSSLCLSCDNL